MVRMRSIEANHGNVIKVAANRHFKGHKQTEESLIFVHFDCISAVSIFALRLNQNVELEARN